jgi:hypothetical protein
MKAREDKSIRSEIIFSASNEVESIEMCYHHLKFVVSKLDTKKPLSFYISPALIKEYAAKDDFDTITINNNVKVLRMAKKGAKNKKK